MLQRGTSIVGVTLAVALVASGCAERGITVAGGAATIDVTVESLVDTPVQRRADAALAWTGEEFLVTGGVVGDEKFGDDGVEETSDDGPVTADGGAMPAHVWDPSTGTWRAAAPSPLSPRSRHVAVWTGTEVLVWGGTEVRNGVGGPLDAAAWDPVTDTWRQLPDSPAGSDRSLADAVVVGPYVVIGGGAGPRSDRDGQLLVLDVRDDSWRVLPGAGAVVQLHDARDGTALVLRSLGEVGVEGYAVARLGVDDAGALTEEQLGRTVPEPSLRPDAPQEAFPMAAGLVGGGTDVALVIEPANMLTEVHLLPARVDDDGLFLPTARVDGLRAPGDPSGFGSAQQLAVDGVAVTFGPGGRPSEAAYDTAAGVARAVEVDRSPSCVNGLSWAVGGGRLLLVSGDCAGEVVTAAPRG